MVYWAGDMEDAWTYGHQCSMEAWNCHPKRLFCARQYRPGVKWTELRREAWEPTHQRSSLPLRERLALHFLWEVNLADIFGCRGNSGTRLSSCGFCEPRASHQDQLFLRWIHNGQRLCSELVDIICRWVKSWHIWALGMDEDIFLHQICRRTTPT